MELFSNIINFLKLDSFNTINIFKIIFLVVLIVFIIYLIRKYRSNSDIEEFTQFKPKYNEQALDKRDLSSITKVYGAGTNFRNHLGSYPLLGNMINNKPNTVYNWIRIPEFSGVKKIKFLTWGGLVMLKNDNNLYIYANYQKGKERKQTLSKIYENVKDFDCEQYSIDRSFDSMITVLTNNNEGYFLKRAGKEDTKRTASKIPINDIIKIKMAQGKVLVLDKKGDLYLRGDANTYVKYNENLYKKYRDNFVKVKEGVLDFGCSTSIVIIKTKDGVYGQGNNYQGNMGVGPDRKKYDRNQRKYITTFWGWHSKSQAGYHYYNADENGLFTSWVKVKIDHTRVKEIHVDMYHTIFKVGNHIYGCGRNNYYQLGYGGVFITTPKLLLRGGWRSDQGCEILGISMQHVVLRDRYKRVKVYGNFSHGVLGMGRNYNWTISSNEKYFSRKTQINNGLRNGALISTNLITPASNAYFVNTFFKSVSYVCDGRGNVYGSGNNYSNESFFDRSGKINKEFYLYPDTQTAAIPKLQDLGLDGVQYITSSNDQGIQFIKEGNNALSNISGSRYTSKELSNRRMHNYIKADQLNDSTNDKYLVSVNSWWGRVKSYAQLYLRNNILYEYSGAYYQRMIRNVVDIDILKAALNQNFELMAYVNKNGNIFLKGGIFYKGDKYPYRSECEPFSFGFYDNRRNKDSKNIFGNKSSEGLKYCYTSSWKMIPNISDAKKVRVTRTNLFYVDKSDNLWIYNSDKLLKDELPKLQKISSDVKDIKSTGYGFNIEVLKKDGNVYFLGYINKQFSLIKHEGVSSVKKIEVGKTHVVALTTNNEVYTQGTGPALGSGLHFHEKFKKLDIENVKNIFTGDHQTYILTYAVGKVHKIQDGPEYEFTSGGKMGREGPTQAEIDEAYKKTVIKTDKPNMAYKNVTVNNGIQTWIVPETGIYSIECLGANAPSSRSSSGGGRAIKGLVKLNKNEKIQILVGQPPNWILDKTNKMNFKSTGGAGGSFVVREKNGNQEILLISAGSSSGSIYYYRFPWNSSYYKGNLYKIGNKEEKQVLSNWKGGAAGFSFDGLDFMKDKGLVAAKSFKNGGMGGKSVNAADGGFGGGQGVYAGNKLWAANFGAGGGGYNGGYGTTRSGLTGDSVIGESIIEVGNLKGGYNTEYINSPGFLDSRYRNSSKNYKIAFGRVTIKLEGYVEKDCIKMGKPSCKKLIEDKNASCKSSGFDSCVAKQKEEICKKMGYKDCNTWLKESKCKEKGYKDCETMEKELACKKAGYRDCAHKAKEDACKKEGYPNCAEKACQKAGYPSCREKWCRQRGYRNCAHYNTEMACKRLGYNNCAHKTKELACRAAGYNNCAHKANEEACKSAGYVDCRTKMREEYCKKQGYKSCAHKKQEEAERARKEAARLAAERARKAAEEEKARQEARLQAEKERLAKLAAARAKVAKEAFQKKLEEAVAKARIASAEKANKEEILSQAKLNEEQAKKIAEREKKLAQAAIDAIKSFDGKKKSLAIEHAKRLKEVADKAMKKANEESNKLLQAKLEQIKAVKEANRKFREQQQKENDLKIAEIENKRKSVEEANAKIRKERASRYAASLKAEKDIYAKESAEAEKKYGTLLKDSQSLYDQAKRDQDKMDELLRKARLDAGLRERALADEKEKLEREMERMKKQEEKDNYIDQNGCYIYSRTLNRDNKIITDQGCSLGNGYSVDNIEQCAAKCSDEGVKCKAFRYRKHDYKGNNCWLSSCDGHDNNNRSDIGRYGLQTGDKDYQFQTYHKVQDGQGWNWDDRAREYANSINSNLCPKANQLDQPVAEEEDDIYFPVAEEETTGEEEELPDYGDSNVKEGFL